MSVSLPKRFVFKQDATPSKLHNHHRRNRSEQLSDGPPVSPSFPTGSPSSSVSGPTKIGKWNTFTLSPDGKVKKSTVSAKSGSENTPKHNHSRTLSSCSSSSALSAHSAHSARSSVPASAPASAPASLTTFPGSATHTGIDGSSVPNFTGITSIPGLPGVPGCVSGSFPDMGRMLPRPDASSMTFFGHDEFLSSDIPSSPISSNIFSAADIVMPGLPSSPLDPMDLSFPDYETPLTPTPRGAKLATRSPVAQQVAQSVSKKHPIVAQQVTPPSRLEDPLEFKFKATESATRPRMTHHSLSLQTTEHSKAIVAVPAPHSAPILTPRRHQSCVALGSLARNGTPAADNERDRKRPRLNLSVSVTGRAVIQTVKAPAPAVSAVSAGSETSTVESSLKGTNSPFRGSKIKSAGPIELKSTIDPLLSTTADLDLRMFSDYDFSESTKQDSLRTVSFPDVTHGDPLEELDLNTLMGSPLGFSSSGVSTALGAAVSLKRTPQDRGRTAFYEDDARSALGRVLGFR